MSSLTRFYDGPYPFIYLFLFFYLSGCFVIGQSRSYQIFPSFILISKSEILDVRIFFVLVTGTDEKAWAVSQISTTRGNRVYSKTGWVQQGNKYSFPGRVGFRCLATADHSLVYCDASRTDWEDQFQVFGVFLVRCVFHFPSRLIPPRASLRFDVGLDRNKWGTRKTKEKMNKSEQSEMQMYYGM